jgi:hypothetical protein
MAQTDEKKKKWGGDTLNFDIKGAVSNYDANLKEFNSPETSIDRKNQINAMYNGDITKWNNKTAYDDYMSDVEYINNIDSLNNAYNAKMESAKKAEQQQIQYADTRRMLMQKYMPETLLAQGVANTGYTADAMLKAENNYNRLAQNAMSERQATEQGALQAYQGALRDYQREQDKKAYKKFKAEQAQDEKTKVGQKNLYTYYKDTMKDGTISLKDIEDDKKEGNITEEQYEELKAEYDNYYGKDSVGSYTAISEIGEFDGEYGDNFEVKLGGEYYGLETDSLVTGEEQTKLVRKAVDSGVKDGSVFLYNGKLYTYKDGQVYSILEESDYDEVKSILSSGQNMTKELMEKVASSLPGVPKNIQFKK